MTDVLLGLHSKVLVSAEWGYRSVFYGKLSEASSVFNGANASWVQDGPGPGQG